MQRPCERYVEDPRQRHRRHMLSKYAVDPEHSHIGDDEPVAALSQPKPDRAQHQRGGGYEW